MAKKKASKKTAAKVEKPAVEAAPAPEPKAEAAPAPAIVNEQIVIRRGTSVGGSRQMTKSDYDKEMKGK